MAKKINKSKKEGKKVTIKINNIENEPNLEGENVQSEKKFSMHTRYFFLTYPQAPENWTLELLRDYFISRFVYKYKKQGSDQELVGKTQIKSLVIGEEKHEDGGKHYHMYITFIEAMRIHSPDYFDIPVDLSGDYIMLLKGGMCFDVLKYHGKYEQARSKLGSINYAKKDGKYISYGILASDAASNYLQASKIERLTSVLDEVKGKAKLEIGVMCDKAMAMQVNGGTNSIVLQTYNMYEKSLEYVPHYPLEKLLLPTVDKSGFFPYEREVAIILYGDVKTGKTSMAKRICMSWIERYFNHRNLEFNEKNSILYEDDVKSRKIINTGRGGKISAKCYDGQGFFLYDELTEEVFQNKQDEIVEFITSEDARTEAYCGNENVPWPRKVMICTNENPTRWKFQDNMKARALFFEVFVDGSFIIRAFDDITKELIVMSVEEFQDKFIYGKYVTKKANNNKLDIQIDIKQGIIDEYINNCIESEDKEDYCM